MKILVFGGQGQVGQELSRHPGVTALDRAGADLSRKGDCAHVIELSSPDVVINVAAYTAVDRAEQDEALAQVINGEAPGEMARTCAALDIPFLHVSTDYVFDGKGKRPRDETVRPAPLNAYGRGKLAGENAIAQAGGRWAIIRTSWVFSARGSNFVKTMLRLGETREHLRVVSDQVGGPTPAADIATTLLAMGRAMAGGHPGGLYHYAGQPAVSWAEFARTIFSQAGQSVSVEDVPSAEYAVTAERPGNSRLDCRKLTQDFGIHPPDWRVGLSLVLQELEIKG